MRYQFRLKTAFVILSAICVAFACVARYRATVAADAAAIRSIESAGFQCLFEGKLLVGVRSVSTRTRLSCNVAAAMSRFRSLAAVDCRDMRISPGPIEILAQRARLRNLSVVGCSIDDDAVRAICDMSSLRRLDMSVSSITDCAAEMLARLKRLEELSISDTSITARGASALASMSELRWLDVSRTAFDDDALSAVARSSRLESLLCDDTSITDSGLAELARVRTMRALSVRNTSVTDYGLGLLNTISNLSELDISSTDVTDEGLAKLGANDLRRLVMVDTKVTDAAVTRFRQTHPGILIKRGFKLTR